MAEEFKVSVIIPTHNRAHLIERAIRSVLDQTYRDFELIVSDDGSTDDTERVVRSIDDDRIVYHGIGKNMGPGGARNEGVKVARYDLIAFHDSDDICMPDRLEKQVRYMSEHPDAGMVYGKLRVSNPGNSFVFPNEQIDGVLEGGPESDMFHHLLIRNTVDAPTTMYRKKLFDETGGFDESLKCLEDWDLAIRFSKRHTVGYIDEVLIESSITENSVSHRTSGYYGARCKMIADNRQALEQYGIFDLVVKDVFERAGESGILPQVKQMLIGYLSM